MLELIDTHCHLDLDDFDPDREAVIERAARADVVHMISIGIDVETSSRAIALAEQYDQISATIGFHPHDAGKLTPDGLDRLKDLAASPQVVGFGEIGLDFYRNLSPRKVQEDRFADLIDLGLELGLPLIIHDRDAHREVLGHLMSVDAGRNGGVIHCFSGDWDLARSFLALGFHISIPGPVTFPKSDQLREVVAKTPLDRLLVETDAPFLAPAPKRGRRNEPALVRYTAAEVARIKGLSLEELARATTINARALFSLPGPAKAAR
ncbi:MAG: TatD family hydrolase [Proteobacteria bacterium]|nr:TatD family hydrolase [Pseudomonadota bacterium]